MQALGALILIALDIVGDICSAETGMSIRSALVPAPQMIIGNTADAI